MKLIRRISSLAMAIDFFYIIGLGGSFENDAITQNQFLIRIVIAFAIFLLLDYTRSTKIFYKKKNASCSCNYSKAHRK